MLKIWGRPTSICTQRVLWACSEAGVEYAMTLSSGTMGEGGHISAGNDPFGNVGTDWYADMNPNRTVPTIDDDGFILWESNAIVSYIALKYAVPTLVASDPAATASALRWMAWTNENLEPPLHTLVMELKRLRPDLRTPGAAAQACEGITPALKLLDNHLRANAYVSGDTFSMGDIPTGAAAYRWKVFAQPGPETPNLDAWLERLGKRKAFAQHVAPPEYHV
ncbi:MAG: glutathione S-transferase family protein [Gammaproteobacteria bacterium]|nr:glutathione S-transferase family protein [Gammaproteobacteria bacterium]